MIMPDDDLVCNKKHSHITGYTALYDVSEDAELATGVTLAANIRGVTYLFQLENTTDILKEENVPVLLGTLYEYQEEYYENEIDWIPIHSCRFPTKEELDWYNSLKSV